MLGDDTEYSEHSFYEFYLKGFFFPLSLQESELSKKRKECEGFEHEVRKRQKRCLDLVSLF